MLDCSRNAYSRPQLHAFGYLWVTDASMWQEYTLERKYPPQFTLGGLKITNGQLKVEGLTIAEDTPEGDYRIKISSTYHSPFGDIKPMYLNFKVQAAKR